MRLASRQQINTSVLLDRAARALAGARVRARALAAHWQAAAMAQSAIGAKVDQALDRHAVLAAQVALDRVLGDFRAQLFDLAFGQLLDLGRGINSRRHAHVPGSSTPDAENALQADHDMLLHRQIDTRNTRHLLVSESGFRAKMRSEP